MKNIFLTFIITIVSFFYTQAQSSTTVFPQAFFVDNDVVNNKIQITNDWVRITGNISINIQLIKDSFLDCVTNIAIMNNQTVLFSVAGPSFYKSSDFVNENYLSSVKNFSLELTEAQVNSILLNNPNAKLVLRYKFRINGNSLYFPDPFGGTEYYIGSHKYDFQLNIAKAIITGPDEIGTEGNFNVKEATTFRVLPDGIDGSINATLTNQGSGNYILTRVGDFVGDVYLEATHSNQSVTTKKVRIIGPPLTIIGEPSICSESIYTITSASSVTLENATGIATLTSLGNNQYKVTRLNAANGVVTIKATNANGNVVNKNITIGIPLLAIVGPSMDVRAYKGNLVKDVSLSVASPNPNVNYTWEISGGAGRVVFANGNSGANITLNVLSHDNMGTNPFTYQVKVNYPSDCGMGSKIYNLKVYPATSTGGVDPL